MLKNFLTNPFKINCITFLVALSVSGCSNTLVYDNTYHNEAGTAYCSGAEWTDDSTMAVLPVPVVAFFMPHIDLNDIKADDYLKRCGDSTKLINRRVDVGHGACVPTVLTRVLTLGIWQWCPAHISWKANVRP